MPHIKLPPAALIKEAVQKGSKIDIVACGSSMVPYIWHRSTVTVGWLCPEDIRKGDIILKGLENSYKVHRVVNTLKEDNGSIYFITKGDFLTRNDPLIQDEEYIGIVERVKNPYIEFNPNALPAPIKKIYIIFSKIVVSVDRIFSPAYFIISRVRFFQLIYRTILSFPVIILSSTLLVIFFIRRLIYGR